MDTPDNKNCISTYSFFFKNLSVTGFHEENALFMTVKELFDNSVDALSNNKIRDSENVCNNNNNLDSNNIDDINNIRKKKKKKIEILIKEYNKDLSFYEIICRDNGEGIEIKDLEKFSDFFLTSKEKDKTSGKFGIGLKTILLYSFKTAYGFLHIKVKVEKNKIWDFMLVIDKNLSHTFVQNFKEYISDEWEWSIEISVILKINSNYIYRDKINYYILLALLWKTDIHVKLCCDNSEPLYYLNEYNINNQESNLLNFIVNNCSDILFKKNNLNSYNVNLNIYIDVKKSDKLHFTSSYINMGVIFLMRYANSMPLFSNSAFDCSITSAFKIFLKQFGPQYGIEPFTVENLEEMYSEEFKSLDFLNSLKQITHTFYVKKSKKSTWNIMILGIDVRGTDISFTNLSKTCIKEGVYLSNLINKCLVNLFNSVKIECAQEFESFSDYQVMQALDIYGMQLASSLSKIILKGREEFKNKVIFLLNEKKKEYTPEIEDNKKRECFDVKNETELMGDLYFYIKEKILSDDKRNENVNTKNISHITSNTSDDDGDYNTGDSDDSDNYNNDDYE
ncbi:DNA topoisomerase VI, b subunit, putative [Hepatocystis sp. ex Piliocolobus tephrosceles]|nr:DNA topoisomerase VI, b subunit, putative [Hepatocystis sp. ex Piliocolobus tephrosceles]